MGSLTKALIGKEDCDVATSGTYETFSRLNSVGSTITMTSFPDIWKSATDMVNAKYYGAHDATGATLNGAVGQSASNSCKDIYIEGGAWLISSSYDWSSYTTVRWIFGSGAYLSIAAGCTVTFPSPSSIVASPNQQIFSGAGTVSFNTTGTVYPDWWQVNTTPGTTDMTTAITAALASGAKVVRFLPATYLVTDTLTIKENYELIGANQYPVTLSQSGLSAGTVFTKILFSPTSEKDLFDITTLTGANTYVPRVYIGGMNCTGNTTGGVTFSKYAINSCAAQSVFENLGLEYFQDGIYCNLTMTNVYKNVYISKMSHACIYTSTSSNTTEIFDNVIMRESPWGAILPKAVGFKFIGCTWESLTVGGIDQYLECGKVEVIGGYSENVPSGAGGDNYGMFYVNKSGSALSASSLTINGGVFGGRNSGGPNGSFLDIGTTSELAQVFVQGAYFTRFVRGIRVDATNTELCSVGVENISHSSITTLYTNETRDNRPVIYGMLSNSQSGTNLPTITAYAGSLNGLTLKDINNLGSADLKGFSSAALVDDGTIEISGWGTGDAGLVLVTMNDGAAIHEAALYSVAFSGGAAVVIKLAGSANTVATNTDTNLCLYPNSGSTMVRNRLGATVICKVLKID